MSKRFTAEEAKAINERHSRGWVAPVDEPLFTAARAKQMGKPKSREARETDECLTFIEWTRLVRYKGRPLYDRTVKIPNERGKRGASIAILVAIGMRKGFPDYIILAPCGRWAGLFIEAKRAKGGDTDDADQNAWRELLIEFGYEAVICEGAHQMILAVQGYFHRAGCETDGSWTDRTQVAA